MVSRIKNVDECEDMARFLIENGMGFLVNDQYKHPSKIDDHDGFLEGSTDKHYPLFSFCPNRLKEVDPEGYKNFLKK